MMRNTTDARNVNSGPDGTFSFTGLGPGEYSLMAHGRGFRPQSYDQHEQYSSAIVVGPDKQSTGIRFRVEPDASISGTIVDEHNEPVMNAQILLFRHGVQNGKVGVFRAGQANTNDQGYYHLAHLRAGEYYVAVSAAPWYADGGRFGYMSVRGGPGMVGRAGFYGGGPGGESNPALDVAFPLTFYPGVTVSGSAEPMHLAPGQRETADFTLTAVPAIHVRVHADEGPQQNVFASVEREAFGMPIFGGARSMNYGQGVTEISGVTPGHYILQLRSAGPNPQGGPQIAVQRQIDITGDMDINATDVPAGVNVTGSLQYLGPPPTTEVRLMLRGEGMPAIPLDIDKDGQISLNRTLAPGEYEIFLPSPIYQLTHIQVAGATLDGQTIHVGSDDVRLTLTAAKASAHISGVARKDDTPFPGAMVVLVPQDMSRPLLFRRDQSDSDGSFQLINISPGTYTVIAIENGWDLEWSKPEVLKAFLKSGNVVQVVMDGDYHVDVNVQGVTPAAPQ